MYVGRVMIVRGNNRLNSRSHIGSESISLTDFISLLVLTCLGVLFLHSLHEFTFIRAYQLDSFRVAGRLGSDARLCLGLYLHH